MNNQFRNNQFRRGHDFFERKLIDEEYITWEEARQYAAHYERKYRGWTAHIRGWYARNQWYDWLGPRTVFRITMTRPKRGRIYWPSF